MNPTDILKIHDDCVGPRRPKVSPTAFTFSWFSFSRSLSHANEDKSRLCSDRRSEPDLVEAWTCAGMLMPCAQKTRLETSVYLLPETSETPRSDGHLSVDRRLLRLQPRALQVLELVLLVDLVVALAPGTAGHVIPHSIVPSLLLHSRDVGWCRGVKEEKQWLQTFMTTSTCFVKKYPTRSSAFPPPGGVVM